MKILFDDQIFRTQAYGGIARYYYELSKKLTQFGNDVKIISPLYRCKYFETSDPLKPLGFYDKINILSYRIVNNLDNFITCLLIKNQANVDIYHETFFCNHNDCYPKSAIRVITVYDMINENLPGFFSPNDKASYYKKIAVERADHIICISKNTKDDLITHFNVPETKISVVYLAASIRKTGEEIRPPVEGPFLLYVGTREPYKNFIFFLNAFADSCAKKELCIVCFGGGLFTKKEKELFRELEISENRIVQISGNDKLLSSLYSSAAAFVFPSLYEGFGLPLLEAMSVECPVICSNASSFPEVAGNAAEYFDPESEKSLIHALENVLFDEARKKFLIKAGLERVKCFSWEKCASETEAVYAKILDK